MEKLYSVEQRAEASLVILEDDREDEENILIGIITQALEDDSDMEGEVNLKEEVISALEELRKSGMNNNYLKEKWSKYQEEKKSKEKEIKTP